MQTIGSTGAEAGRSGGERIGVRVVTSLAVHAVALGLVALAVHQRPAWVAPYRLPGSPKGSNLVMAYLPDRAPEQTAAAKKAVAKPVPVVAATSPLAQVSKAVAPAAANTQASPDPNATTGADALGSGNISIALTSYFPWPKPDLSAVPHGTRGDVMLRVVIGADGKISDVEDGERAGVRGG